MALAFVLLGPCVAWAGTLKEDPGGFDGIKWLSPVSDVPALHLIYDDTEFITYIKTGPQVEIAGAMVESVRYQFYKGRFANVQIRYRGDENFQKLGGWITAMRVLPIISARNPARLVLSGPDTIISLQYDRVEGRGILSFASRLIESELLSESLADGG
jgi:hypothetical protein